MLCNNTLMLSKFSNISPLSVPFCLAILPYIPITYVTFTYTYMCNLICKYTFRHDVFHENILIEFIYIEENGMSKAELPNWKYIDVRTKINQELKISLKVIVEIFLSNDKRTLILKIVLCFILYVLDVLLCFTVSANHIAEIRLKFLKERVQSIGGSNFCHYVTFSQSF